MNMKKILVLLLPLFLSVEMMAQKETSGSKFITANASYNNYGKLSYGLTFGSVKKAGWFASVTTNFNFKLSGTDFECGDNFIVNGYYPYYKSGSSYSSLSVIGGFIYRISQPIALRIGAGYGNRTIVYKMIDDRTVKNTDASASGVDFSLGAQYNIGMFMASLDCVTTNFKIFEIKIGLGLNLNK